MGIQLEVDVLIDKFELTHGCVGRTSDNFITCKIWFLETLKTWYLRPVTDVENDIRKSADVSLTYAVEKEKSSRKFKKWFPCCNTAKEFRDVLSTEPITIEAIYNVPSLYSVTSTGNREETHVLGRFWTDAATFLFHNGLSISNDNQMAGPLFTHRWRSVTLDEPVSERLFCPGGKPMHLLFHNIDLMLTAFATKLSNSSDGPFLNSTKTRQQISRYVPNDVYAGVSSTRARKKAEDLIQRLDLMEQCVSHQNKEPVRFDFVGPGLNSFSNDTKQILLNSQSQTNDKEGTYTTKRVVNSHEIYSCKPPQHSAFQKPLIEPINISDQADGYDEYNDDFDDDDDDDDDGNDHDATECNDYDESLDSYSDRRSSSISSEQTTSDKLETTHDSPLTNEKHIPQLFARKVPRRQFSYEAPTFSSLLRSSLIEQIPEQLYRTKCLTRVAEKIKMAKFPEHTEPSGDCRIPTALSNYPLYAPASGNTVIPKSHSCSTYWKLRRSSLPPLIRDHLE